MSSVHLAIFLNHCLLSGLTCTCGPFECGCRWRSEPPTESYAAPSWTPPEPKSYAAYASPPAPALPTQPYDPTALSDDIFHPEEIFQLDQPIRMEFGQMEQNGPLDSPPTFAELSGDSRSEDSYWFEWQGAAGGSESSEAPSPELFGNGYQQAEAYCEQQNYSTQAYYPEEAQYYAVECSRTSPVLETDQQRYYRGSWNGQECAPGTGLETPAWNYNDCAFTSPQMADCRDFDMQQQTVNAFSALTYN